MRPDQVIGFQRATRRLRLPILALAGVVIAHDAIFASDVGVTALAGALRRSGHGDAWTALSLVSLSVAFLAGLAAVARIARLRREAASVGSQPRRLSAPVAPPPGYPSYAGEVRALWPRLVVLVGLGFLVQENVEALSGQAPLPGLQPLFGAHPLALPVLLAVTLAMALVGALLRWQTRALEARVRQLRAALPRLDRSRPQLRHRREGHQSARRSIRLRPEAGRAPPLPAGTISA
jgi:hypothetical protein